VPLHQRVGADGGRAPLVQVQQGRVA
jgi:hypothetical protein